MNFKTYIQEHFRSCPLLAEGKDPHRGRNVRLYMLPGEQRYVGVSDGVDAFVAPVDIKPFGVDCRKAIGELLARIAMPQAGVMPAQRVRVTVATATQPKERIRVQR